jgi:hypothetical protein
MVAQQNIKLLACRLSTDARLSERAKEVLEVVRQRCFARMCALIGIQPGAAAAFDISRDDISLWGFDVDRHAIRPIAGTYPADSGFWRAQLPYGAGIRGSTMKRGTNEFYRLQPVKHTDFYHPHHGCPAERHLLCVPIPLPIPARLTHPAPADGAASASFGRCWMVACIAGYAHDSLWQRLTAAAVRNAVSELLLFEVLDLVKEIVPELDTLTTVA